MNIIVGLGNPGRKYVRTRHNAGFMAADELAGMLDIEIKRERPGSLLGRGRSGAEDVVIAKPQTFMNASGEAVSALLSEFYASHEDLVVIHDDIDLPLGTVRIKTGGGHGGHNGLRSIMETTGSGDFVRVRIGIGRPPVGMDSADYVLSPFLEDERQAASEAVGKAAEAARLIINHGASKAMNEINQK